MTVANSEFQHIKRPKEVRFVQLQNAILNETEPIKATTNEQFEKLSDRKHFGVVCMPMQNEVAIDGIMFTTTEIHGEEYIVMVLIQVKKEEVNKSTGLNSGVSLYDGEVRAVMVKMRKFANDLIKKEGLESSKVYILYDIFSDKYDPVTLSDFSRDVLPHEALAVTRRKDVGVTLGLLSDKGMHTGRSD